MCLKKHLFVQQDFDTRDPVGNAFRRLSIQRSVSVLWCLKAVSPEVLDLERLTMKKLALLAVACLTFSCSNLFAQEAAPAPVVEPAPQAAPAPVEHPAVELYCNVKYKDLDEMAPCASPKIIAVKDPCACHDSCCAPPCVYIKICVPCGCEVVTCSKNGDRIRYDYGKYAVDVRVKKGYIEVDYQD